MQASTWWCTIGHPCQVFCTVWDARLVDICILFVYWLCSPLVMRFLLESHTAPPIITITFSTTHTSFQSPCHTTLSISYISCFHHFASSQSPFASSSTICALFSISGLNTRTSLSHNGFRLLFLTIPRTSSTLWCSCLLRLRTGQGCSVHGCRSCHPVRRMPSKT